MGGGGPLYREKRRNRRERPDEMPVVVYRMNGYAMGRFRAGPQYRGHTARINSLEFARSGDRMVSADDDSRMVLYHVHGTVAGGGPGPTAFCRLLGVELARFGHDGTAVLHNSPRSPGPTIRYFSLNRNMDILSYTDHTTDIVSLCISPTREVFASASTDGNIMIWDLRLKKCRDSYKYSMKNPLIAFDEKGLVLAVGSGSKQIDFFDVRAYFKPLWSIEFPENEHDWTDLQFSPDNFTLLITTNGSKMILLNHNSEIQTFYDSQNIFKASFTPDSQYLFGGSSDGCINVWKANSGQRIFTLSGGHNGPVKCIKFNPKYMIVASACNHTTFWMHELNINFTNGVANLMDYEFGF